MIRNTRDLQDANFHVGIMSQTFIHINSLEYSYGLEAASGNNLEEIQGNSPGNNSEDIPGNIPVYF